MTISDGVQRAFVWVWLPGAEAPVVAGRLDEAGGRVTFRYGRSYLERHEAVALSLPELPLRRGRIDPLPELTAPGCILDAGPDSWGQRVIVNRLMGRTAREMDTGELSPLVYLLESGSDRIGALDFQSSAEVYEPRGGPPATLDELVTFAERVEAGLPLPPELDTALLAGSSVGGARPKALLTDGSRTMIAKFSSTTDVHSVVKGEFVAMRLAKLAGLDVATVGLRESMGKDVLLVDRFDRLPGAGRRRLMVSALTLLELNELAAGHASYAELSGILRARSSDPVADCRELFRRLVFNVLVGNTDDHARNHAAFWDGEQLKLTPAYDICPQPRSGGEASQGMIIGDERDRFWMSHVAGCVERSGIYGVERVQAREIAEQQISVIREHWDSACDEAAMTEIDRATYGRVFLHAYALQGW